MHICNTEAEKTDMSAEVNEPHATQFQKQKAAVVTSVGGNAFQSGVSTILEFLILIQYLE